MTGFNSRARKGRDSWVGWVASGALCFNSRARKGRDIAKKPFGKATPSFNSRARKGRDRARRPRRQSLHCFNSRARKGRDSHAFQVTQMRREFQFTRPQGARPDMPPEKIAELLFQFTRPQGARRVVHARALPAVRVSIHAPARGATDLQISLGVPRWFQFTRPQGARRGGAVMTKYERQFQFTRPQGARPSTPVRHRGWRSFNSRARKGRDRARLERLLHLDRFQFTRPQGARRTPHPTVSLTQ